MHDAIVAHLRLYYSHPQFLCTNIYFMPICSVGTCNYIYHEEEVNFDLILVGRESAGAGRHRAGDVENGHAQKASISISLEQPL